MGALLQDLRYAVRMLAKSPGFTAVAVLTLALGIGAVTAIVSMIKCLVLDPLPYPAASRLVRIWWDDPSASVLMRDRRPLYAPDYLDLREQATSFEDMGAWAIHRFNLGGDKPESVQGAACSAGLLRTLGVRPALGRWFADAEAQPGMDHVAVIGHGLWSRRFAADPKVIGQAIRLNGQSFTVVGVMPPGFFLASAPWESRPAFDVWTPLVLNRNDRGSNNLLVAGRLKPGATQQAAETELKTVAGRLALAHPETNQKTTFWQAPASVDDLMAGAFIHFAWLLASVWMVLALASKNVAGMLLARGLGRQSEMAVRVSLGAARRHIVRLLLTESLLLSLIAGATGILLAVWSLHVLTGLLPPGLAPRTGVRIDGWMLLFSAGLAGLTALMSGLTPALAAAKTDLMSTLKEGGTSQAGSQASQRRLRQLAIGQILLAIVLVNGAILLSSSYRNLLVTHRALATDQVLTAEITLPGPNYARPEARIALWDQLVGRVRTLPSVSAAAVCSKLPLEWGRFYPVLREGESFDPKTSQPYLTIPQWSTVSPAYFSAMGIPLLKGRLLEDADAGTPGQHVVINRTMADRLWPGQDPLGQRVRQNAAVPGWSAIVVGVVGDVRQRSMEGTRPEMYFPYTWIPAPDARLVVRSQGDSRALTGAIRKELAGLDADLALGNVRSMGEVFATNTRSYRFLTAMIDLFMALALGLAAIGVYGTLSFHVAQRSREIGVRIAMGADRRAILLMVLGQAGRWVGIGVAAGLAATLGGAEILRAMVHGTSPLDARSLAAGVAVVLAASLVACWLPAHRATRTQPVEVLRAG
jgi:putative ABC transport system permease protein